VMEETSWAEDAPLMLDVQQVSFMSSSQLHITSTTDYGSSCFLVVLVVLVVVESVVVIVVVVLVVVVLVVVWVWWW
jgi:hypothetical protein